MVDVQTDIFISAPLEKVAVFATDPSNAPKWYDNIKSAEWLTPKPIQLGSKIAFKAQFLARSMAYTYVVVEFIPLKKLVMQTDDGPFAMETTYTWEAPKDGQTYMRLRNRGNPSGFSKLMAPFMVAAMKHANKKDLKKLKKLIEFQTKP